MKWQNNFHGASTGRIWRYNREFMKKSGFLGLSIGIVTTLASVSSAPAVFAEGLTLTVPQALSFDVTPNLAESAGTFGKSQASSLSAQTTTAFGYTLSLKLKNDDNSNKLMNGDHFLTSIGTAMTEDQFKSTADANTWGFLPNKFNKIDNASYQPGPTVETVLDETDTPDGGATPYSIGLAAKVNSEAAPGSYNNTFVVTLTANAVNYTVKYDLNGDGATGGPAAPLTGSSVEETATVKIGSEVPTRDGYEFKGWCTAQTSDENCSGTAIEAGGDLTLNDLKKDNDNTVTLWGMWKTDGVSYSISYKSLIGSPTNMPGIQTGIIAGEENAQVKLSATTPYMANYSFKGWCDKETTNEKCEGKSYNPGSDYVLPEKNNIIVLYAKWYVSIYPTCTVSGTSGRKVGNYCWMWYDYRDSVTKKEATCPSGWHLPSQSEYENLLSIAGNGDRLYLEGWSGHYWSSTTSPMYGEYACRFFVGSSANITEYGSTTHCKQRCVAYSNN